MGFRELARSVCPQGHCIGASGLYLRTQDTVKLGILYLCGGMWHQQRVFSREWVELVMQQEYEFKLRHDGWYAKGGLRGQMLAFNPSLGRAVAWHAYESRGCFEDIVHE
jgi:CubicO group peptidase (beta-lactamase class C family)